MGWSSRQTINRETVYLNYMLDQMDLTGVHKTFDPTVTEYTFFSKPQWYKTRNGIKLEINGKRKLGKSKNVWKLNNPEQSMVRRRNYLFKKILKTKMDTRHKKCTGCRKGSYKRDVYGDEHQH